MMPSGGTSTLAAGGMERALGGLWWGWGERLRKQPPE